MYLYISHRHIQTHEQSWYSFRKNFTISLAPSLINVQYILKRIYVCMHECARTAYAALSEGRRKRVCGLSLSFRHAFCLTKRCKL